MTTAEPAVDANWMEQAACSGAPMEIFITSGDGDDEPPYPRPEAKWYCDRCPVRKECLDWAQSTGAVGTWGGTSTYQRSVLRRPRQRKGCPGCESKLLVVEQGKELCLACGVSWYV